MFKSRLKNIFKEINKQKYFLLGLIYLAINSERFIYTLKKRKRHRHEDTKYVFITKEFFDKNGFLFFQIVVFQQIK